LDPFFRHFSFICQVYDWDQFSKNDPLGEVPVYLGEVNFEDRTPKWAVLQVGPQ
jgi:hypothetical protein